MRLKGSVRQINLLSSFFLLNLNFVTSTRIAKLAPVLTRQNSIRVQGIFFSVPPVARNRLSKRAVRTTGGMHLIVLLDGKNPEDSEDETNSQRI